LDWSIIIFCFNEKNNLSKVLESVFEFVKNPQVQNYEILIVDDGSTDGSVEVINDKIKGKKNAKILSHAINRGIGQALRTGYFNAQLEYVCAIPGDNQFDIEELLKVKPFGSDTFYSFYRTNLYKNSYRKLIHILNKLFNKWFLNIQIKDVNWIKVYRNDQLKKVDFQLQSSIVESEICAKLFKLGAKPIELPSKYLPRDYGTPKGGTWKTVSMAVKESWSLFWVVKKFKA
jgi:glycosyltransferase involved in cell wall biosynthesis